MRSSASCGMSKMSDALSTSSSSLHNMSPLKNMSPEVSNALAKVKATIYFFLIFLFHLILRKKATYDLCHYINGVHGVQFGEAKHKAGRAMIPSASGQGSPAP